MENETRDYNGSRDGGLDGDKVFFDGQQDRLRGNDAGIGEAPRLLDFRERRLRRSPEFLP